MSDNAKPKYKAPVYIYATASKLIGHVECDSAEDYKKKAKELWEAIGFDTPAVHESNDFHLSEVWETGSIPEAELETYYKQEKDDAE